MTNKDKIQNLALEVNDYLNAYTTVHNKINKQAGTLLSFMRNLLGIGIPMSKLLKECEQLIPMWNTVNLKMEKFEKSNLHLLTDQELNYYDVVVTYATKLHYAVLALIDRQLFLTQKSEGGNNQFTLAKFNEKQE